MSHVSTAYWLYQIKCNSLISLHRSISLLSSLHIHCSSSEIPKLKTQNSKSSLRIPQWLGVSDFRSLNLFLSANNQPPSTSTTALASRPWSFLFFHNRRPTSSISAATVRTRVHTTTTASLQSSPGKSSPQPLVLFPCSWVLLFPVPGVLFFRFSVSYSDVVMCVTLFLYSFFTVRISVSLQFLYLC